LNASKPPTTTSKIENVGKVPTQQRKVYKLIKTVPDKRAEIFRGVGDNYPFIFDSNGFYFETCTITEVIKFLQNLAETPNASEQNVALTKHIAGAIMKTSTGALASARASPIIRNLMYFQMLQKYK
jgi:hypothetical protein